jgi:hypothetical protein
VVLEYGDGDQFAYGSMMREEPKRELTRALKKAFGRDIRVEIAKGTGSPPPVDQKKNLEDDPLVQRIVEQFDGVVVETRHNTEDRDRQ